MSRNSSPGCVGLRVIFGSVILDEIDLVRVAVFPLERDAPWAIDIYPPSYRLGAAIGMKPQAGEFQIIQRLSPVKSVKNLNATLRQILPDAAAPSGLKQFLETFVGERQNHVDALHN